MTGPCDDCPGGVDWQDRAEKAGAERDEARIARDAARDLLALRVAQRDAAYSVIHKCNETLTFGGLLIALDDLTDAETDAIRRATGVDS